MIVSEDKKNPYDFYLDKEAGGYDLWADTHCLANIIADSIRKKTNRDLSEKDLSIIFHKCCDLNNKNYFGDILIAKFIYLIDKAVEQLIKTNNFQ